MCMWLEMHPCAHITVKINAHDCILYFSFIFSALHSRRILYAFRPKREGLISFLVSGEINVAAIAADHKIHGSFIHAVSHLSVAASGLPSTTVSHKTAVLIWTSFCKSIIRRGFRNKKELKMYILYYCGYEKMQPAEIQCFFFYWNEAINNRQITWNRGRNI